MTDEIIIGKTFPDAFGKQVDIKMYEKEGRWVIDYFTDEYGWSNWASGSKMDMETVFMFMTHISKL